MKTKISRKVIDMENTIDLSRSVYDICRDHPDVLGIMKALGFENITNPGILNTAGRVMTISKGASLKKIPMEKIIEVFSINGYEIKE
jgi:hypothetical protein